MRSGLQVTLDSNCTNLQWRKGTVHANTDHMGSIWDILILHVDAIWLKSSIGNDLTKGSKGWRQRVKWSPECERDFRELKEALCRAPVLQAPDFHRLFLVLTDASGRRDGSRSGPAGLSWGTPCNVTEKVAVPGRDEIIHDWNGNACGQMGSSHAEVLPPEGTLWANSRPCPADLAQEDEGLQHQTGMVVPWTQTIPVYGDLPQRDSMDLSRQEPLADSNDQARQTSRTSPGEL